MGASDKAIASFIFLLDAIALVICFWPILSRKRPWRK